MAAPSTDAAVRNTAPHPVPADSDFFGSESYKHAVIGSTRWGNVHDTTPGATHRQISKCHVFYGPNAYGVVPSTLHRHSGPGMQTFQARSQSDRRCSLEVLQPSAACSGLVMLSRGRFAWLSGCSART